ncbi:MAG: hypothetical protein JWO32_2455 [Bacteroidetes bacterium]|nr:hypothetical protein [Bacteroidota bacterium]
MLLSNYCFSQLPDTDLWLFSIKNEKEKYTIQKGVNITNREGYDNQPIFSPDGKSIYYVSIQKDKQADIYMYSIGNKKSKKLTNTSTSEYSPTFTSQKGIIACVTVLGDSSQVILPYDLKTGQVLKDSVLNINLKLNTIDSVGYFTFLNSDTILYYKLTKPHSLRAYSIKGNTDVFLGYNPIRGFKAINRYEFIYGIKDSSAVTFYKYNTLLSKAEKFCTYNTLNEDIVWDKRLGLLKSEGATILQFNEKENKWIQLFDFSPLGIIKITRFTFDAAFKKIVLVNNLK